MVTLPNLLKNIIFFNKMPVFKKLFVYLQQLNNNIYNS